MHAHQKLRKIILTLLLCLLPALAFGTEAAKAETFLLPVQRDILQRLDMPLDLPAVQVEKDDIILTNLGLFRRLGVPEDQFTAYTWSRSEWHPAKQPGAGGEERIVLKRGEAVVKDFNDENSLVSLALSGDSSIRFIHFLPVSPAGFTEGKTIQESWLIDVWYQNGASASIGAEGFEFRFVVDEWDYTLKYDADGWLISSIVNPAEAVYPDFRYRLNHYGTQYQWDAYFENGIGYTSAAASPWFDYNDGKTVQKPENINLEEMWPFRVITPEGRILTFEEAAVIVTRPIRQETASERAFWLDPPEMKEAVFQTLPVSFPELPGYEVIREQDSICVKIAWADPAAWGLLPEDLRTWTLDPQSGDWTASGEPADSVMTLILPAVPSEEGDDSWTEAAWESARQSLPELAALDLTVIFDREGVRELTITAALSERDILYEIEARPGGQAGVSYGTDGSKIYAAYVSGRLNHYSVYRRTDSYALDYTYLVTGEDEQVLNAIYCWEHTGDREIRDCILQGGQWFRFTDNGMEKTDASDLTDLCQPLPLMIPEEP